MPFRFKEIKNETLVWDGSKRTFPEARTKAKVAYPGCTPVEIYYGCRVPIMLKGQRVGVIDFVKSSYAHFKGVEPGLELPKLICERCRHTWTPRNGSRLPKVCPKCKSPYWDKERVKDRERRRYNTARNRSRR
jgi:hypothetical protein